MISIVIATPFYEIKGYSPYISSLMNSIKILHELDIKYDYYELSGDSYVDRAKNSLVDKFLKSDFSHLLMIDSDLAWDVKGFGLLLKAGILGAEVVGGTYPNKNNWATYGVLPLMKDGELLGQTLKGVTLLEVVGIPGGFILYSRKAFERTRDNLGSYKDYLSGEDHLECFRCAVEKGQRVGEDIYFQRRYRESGGKVWLQPDISFSHYGVKGWDGNYHEVLLKRKENDDCKRPDGCGLEEVRDNIS